MIIRGNTVLMLSLRLIAGPSMRPRMIIRGNMPFQRHL